MLPILQGPMLPENGPPQPEKGPAAFSMGPHPPQGPQARAELLARAVSAARASRVAARRDFLLDMIFTSSYHQPMGDIGPQGDMGLPQPDQGLPPQGMAPLQGVPHPDQGIPPPHPVHGVPPPHPDQGCPQPFQGPPEKFMGPPWGNCIRKLPMLHGPKLPSPGPP